MSVVSNSARHATIAEQIWERCKPATEDHPYIQARRGYTTGVRVVPGDDELEIAGVRMANSLVVPCLSSDGRIVCLQFIKPPETPGAFPNEGKARTYVLPACTMNGYFAIGEQTEGAKTFIVNSIPAAWAVHRVTGSRALVLFDHRQLTKFVQFIRNSFRDLSVVIALNKGLEKLARSVAQLERVAVTFLPGNFPNHYNLNDYADNHGDDSLFQLLQAASVPQARFALLSSAEIKQMPPVEWRVRGVLPARGLAAIYGPSGSGKSFLALDLAAAIASGSRWFGCRIDAAPVVYVALEGEAGFKLRVEAWEKHQQCQLPKSIRFLLGQFKLADGTEIERKDLTDLASLVPKGAVIVLDTLNRAAPMSDENSSKEMGTILEASKRLQEFIDGMVILIHHSGKNVASGLRGHSSLLAALDAVIEVKRDHERRSWGVVKSKNDVDGVTHPFLLKQVDLGKDSFGERITSCVIVQDDSLQRVAKIKVPSGSNQKIAYDALDSLLGQLSRKKLTNRPNVVPINVPFVTLDEAVREVSSRLTCPHHRRVTRAREVIGRLVANEFFVLREDCLWKSQK